MTSAAPSFCEAQQQTLSDTVKTGLLLSALAALVAAGGYVILGATGAVASLAFTLLLVGLSFQASLGLTLQLRGGVPLHPSEAPQLFRTVSELSARAGIRPPRLYLIPGPEANAMTAGLGDDRGILAVTEGALRTLDADELEGVLAHEIGHLRNHDTAILQIAGIAARVAVGLLRAAVWLLLITALLVGAELASMLQLTALAIAVKVVVSLLVPALSRTREHAADATAASLTGKPWALASALAKLERQQRSWLGLLLGVPAAPAELRSHPPTAERIQRLQALGPQPPVRPRAEPPWQAPLPIPVYVYRPLPGPWAHPLGRAYRAPCERSCGPPSRRITAVQAG